MGTSAVSYLQPWIKRGNHNGDQLNVAPRRPPLNTAGTGLAEAGLTTADTQHGYGQRQ